MLALRTVFRSVSSVALVSSSLGLAVHAGDLELAGAADGPGLALRAAKILTAAVAGPQAIDHAVLLVRDGKIEAIGEADEVVIPEGFVELDVGEQWLMPGMIDLHNHTGSRSFDFNDTVYLANPGLRASSNVEPRNPLYQRGVAGGVTSVLFIPGSGSNIGGQGVLLKIGHDRWEEIVIRDPGSLKIAQSGNPESWTVGVGRTVQNWNTRNSIRRGRRYARAWDEYEASGGERPKRNIQWDVFRDLYADRTQVSVHTQIYQMVHATLAILVEELGLPIYIDHGTFDGHRLGAWAEELEVPAILGPRMVSIQFVVEHPLIGSINVDTDGKILGVAAEFQKEGHTRVGFNTDCVDNGFFGPGQEELQLQAGMAVRYGFEDEDAESVRGLTIVPAQAAGIADRVGSLEVGKDADIVVIGGDPNDPRSAVERVFQDGELVYCAERDGRRW